MSTSGEHDAVRAGRAARDGQNGSEPVGARAGAEQEDGGEAGGVHGDSGGGLEMTDMDSIGPDDLDEIEERTWSG